jgi:hypothetical protein
MYAPNTSSPGPAANVGSEADGQRHEGVPRNVGALQVEPFEAELAHATFETVHDPRVEFVDELHNDPLVVYSEYPRPRSPFASGTSVGFWVSAAHSLTRNVGP